MMISSSKGDFVSFWCFDACRIMHLDRRVMDIGFRRYDGIRELFRFAGNKKIQDPPPNLFISAE
jgi:hypothetical protein